MGDYDYFSPENVRVATEGLRTASTNWMRMALQMRSVASAAAQQKLEPSAFVVLLDGPIAPATTIDLHNAYTQEFEKLTSLFQEAGAHFTMLSTALAENADWYEDADAQSAQSFDGIAEGDWPH